MNVYSFGQHLQMGGVSVRSYYDPAGGAGHMEVTISKESTPDQRKAVAEMIRIFADGLEREAD
jgi:hypothetical protein